MLEQQVLGTPSTWRLLATRANGQPAAVLYRRDGSNVLRGYGLVVLAATATGITRVTAFHDPALVTLFGFAAELAE